MKALSQYAVNAVGPIIALKIMETFGIPSADGSGANRMADMEYKIPLNSTFLLYFFDIIFKDLRNRSIERINCFYKKFLAGLLDA